MLALAKEPVWSWQNLWFVMIMHICWGAIIYLTLSGAFSYSLQYITHVNACHCSLHTYTPHMLQFNFYSLGKPTASISSLKSKASLELVLKVTSVCSQSWVICKTNPKNKRWHPYHAASHPVTTSQCGAAVKAPPPLHMATARLRSLSRPSPHWKAIGQNV